MGRATRRAPSATGAKGRNLEGFERHAFDYERYYWRLDPLAAFFAPSFSNQPVRYSDAVADRRAFLNSEFFVDFVSTMSVRHGIGCQLVTGGRPVGGLALHRQGRRDFSAREKEIYRLLAPHLARALGRGAGPVTAVAVGAAADAVLTRREREIAALAAAGLRNREIAQRCFITEQTVKDHLRSVFEKLGVRNRTELAVRSGRPIGGDLE